MKIRKGFVSNSSSSSFVVLGKKTPFTNISLDEFGQRKMKSKLADIEAALTRVGQIAIPLMQQLYTTQKIFRGKLN